ncbi:MAG: Eco57I restriction-modification methylase domain-containing protein [Promethearchaeota archaeon]
MNLLENPDKIDELYNSVLNAIEFNKYANLRDNLFLINDIERKFESNYSKKKKEGVFYTQKEISDFIFSEALISLLNKEFENLNLAHIDEIYSLNLKIQNKLKKFLLGIRICDPACGSGVLLLSAASIIHKLMKKLHYDKTPIDLKLKIINNLYGFEINDSAIKLSKLNLLNWFYHENPTRLKELLVVLNSNLKQQNSLINIKTSNFDIVIGNPPYGNILRSSHKDFLKTEKIFYNDIYCAFILKAIRWTESIIAFLVPKSFLLRQGYIKFRNNLLTKSNLLKIYDIGPNLFKKATNEVQIVIYEKRGNISKDLRVYKYPNEEITSYRDQKVDSLRICFNEKCNLNDKTKKVFVYSFQEFCPYCGSETVLMNRIRIKANQEILELISKIEHSGDLNYLNIKDFPMMIRGEEATGLKKVKNLIKNNLDGSCIFINAKEDFTYFYFKKKKSFNIDSINAELLKGNNYEYYINPKLLLKHNSIYPQAVFTEEKACFTSSIYSLLHADNDELKYLCAILNSSLMQFYCRYAINNQRDTTINLNQYMIRHLPIIHCQKDSKQGIITKVNKISQILLQSNGKLTNTAKQFIKEIDNLVFELYSITDQEKKTIISIIKEQIEFFRDIY